MTDDNFNNFFYYIYRGLVSTSVHGQLPLCSPILWYHGLYGSVYLHAISINFGRHSNALVHAHSYSSWIIEKIVGISELSLDRRNNV